LDFLAFNREDGVGKNSNGLIFIPYVCVPPEIPEYKEMVVTFSARMGDKQSCLKEGY
jgi:hypothetical protein